MNRTKTMVFLGASVDQAPSLRAARELGMRVIAFDSNPRAFALRYAHEHYPLSVRDHQAIAEQLGERAIDGIYSQASDAARMAEYHLAKCYNTPKKISLASVHASMDKAYFLNRLQAADLPAHRHVKSDRLAELRRSVAHWPFPFVVKPNDSSGSKGVCLVDSADLFEQALAHEAAVSPTHTVICEELVSGSAISVDAFIRDYQVEFMTISEKIMSQPPLMIPLHYIMPARVTSVRRQRLRRHLGRISEILEIESGPVTCDVVVRDDETIHVIELGARAGGNGLSILMNQAYGANYTEAALALHVGEHVPVAAKHHRFVALLTMTSPVEGLLVDIQGVQDLFDRREIAAYESYYQNGDRVCRFENASQKLGHVLLTGDSAAELRGKIDRVKENFVIHLEADNEIYCSKLA